MAALLREIVAASSDVAATSSRTAKVQRLADALRALAPGEIEAGAAFLAGDLRQRQIGVGWAAVRDAAPPPAAEPTLTVGEVDAAFAAIGAMAGAGSQAARREALTALLGRATSDEQAFLRGLLSGGLRQGALEGVLTDAIARAAELPLADVRRAAMLAGDLRAVARIALTEGAAGLAAVRLEVGRPIGPMLAGTAKDVRDALAKIASPPALAAVEWKLDGARVQLHRDGSDVGVFTRSLDDVTARVPELVEAALALPARSLVLDGEAIALQPDGRPYPFQVTASRFGSRNRTDLPLTGLWFDALHLDGEDLLDRAGADRFAALAAVVPESQRVPRKVVEDAAGATAVLESALALGHEGVMVKALDAPYAAGRRGAGWLKVKPVHTLDLVVLAVEWGHGRRTGLLSNLHLGARADDAERSGGEPAGRDRGFVMLGKTFKGLTDEMLHWQTEHLRALAVSDSGWVVHVRPELVVEIAFDGVQASTRYPGGVALRFARVLRHRPDKRPEEADLLSAVQAFLPP